MTALGVVMVLLAAAADDCPPEDETLSRGRILNGHVFMPVDSVPVPFATTNFGSAMLLGYGTTSTNLVINGVDFSKDLQYAGTGGLLRYELSILDHFSMRAGVGTLIYSGIDGRSAVAIGSSVVFGVEAGVTGTLLVGNRVRLSLLFDFKYSPNIALTIGTAANAIISSCGSPDGCSVDAGSIFSLINLATYKPAIAAAWSPWRPLGIQAFTGFTLGTTPNTTLTTGGAMIAGGTADFDFMPLWRVPLGLQVQANATVPVMGTAIQRVTEVGGGIFYTGKKELSAGVQLAARRFAVRENVEVSWGLLATIGLRYYW
jgi:hypothetical protein